MSRLALLLPAVLLVLLAGALLGGGLVARHYRPQLEEALGQLTASRVASGQLEALLDEQQRALAAVRASAERRAASPTTPRPVRVEVPLAVPCRVPDVRPPSWASATLQAGDSLQAKVRALLAERRQRQGYELELQAALRACR